MTMFPPSTIHYNGQPRSNTPPPPIGTINKHGPIGSSPPRPTEGMVVALRWLTAIQEATQCLRDPEQGPQQQNVQAIEHALHYLMELEALLTPFESQWDQGPTKDPPKFVPYQAKAKTRRPQKKKGRAKTSNNVMDQSPTSVMEPEQQQGGWTTMGNKKTVSPGNNRFALFLEDSDAEDDSPEHTLFKEEDDKSDDVITGKTIISSCSTASLVDDLQEAGDVPTLNRIAHFPSGTVMGMRRLMIRIVTAQSELFAFQASGYRRRQAWNDGAKNCHASLCKIHQGLMLADSEISRCFAEGCDIRERQPLMEDASIVEVAVKSLTQERDSFVQKALVAKHQLIRKLEAIYIGRYKARMRMGDDWFKNRPKKPSQSQYREQTENELVEVQMALDNLGQWDSHTLLATADHLKLRLNNRNGKRHQDGVVRPRNNQQRPFDISKRVDLNLYPDPTNFDWTFTGTFVDGEERIEFFEKQNILLDFHFTTGQVELSWKHLSRPGNTTFFRSVGPVHSMFFMETINGNPWEVVKKYSKKNSSC